MWVCRDSWRHALVAVFSSGSSLSHAWAMSDDDARLCGWAASALGLAVDEVRALVVDLALDEPLEFDDRRAPNRSREEINLTRPRRRATRSSRARRARRACRRSFSSRSWRMSGMPRCRRRAHQVARRARRCLAALQLAGDFLLDERLAAACSIEHRSPGPGAAADASKDARHSETIRGLFRPPRGPRRRAPRSRAGGFGGSSGACPAYGCRPRRRLRLLNGALLVVLPDRARVLDVGVGGGG